MIKTSTALAMVRPRSRRREWKSAKPRPAAAAMAMITSLVGLEILLRVWITPTFPLPWPPPNDTWQPGDLPAVHTVRQVSEGVACSHYSADGRRQAMLSAGDPGARIILLGDSFVEANQLYDHETIGANLEKIALSRGIQMRAMQYGWPGAAPPAYIRLAEQMSALKPEKVVLVLNPVDFAEWHVLSGRFWRFDRTFQIVPNPDSRTRFTPVLETLKRTVLFSRACAQARRLLTHLENEKLEGNPPPLTSRIDPQVVHQIVRQSKRAYGEKLVLVYLAERYYIHPEEQELERYCASEKVRLINIRKAEQQDANYWFGFSNTVIGEGHLNAYGAEQVARLLWKEVQ